MGSGRIAQPPGGREGARGAARRHRQDRSARRQCAVRARSHALARRAGDRLRDLGRYEPAIGRMYRRSARRSLETRQAKDRGDPRVGRGQLPAQRRHLEKGCRFAAPPPRHPHPPAPGELLRDGNRLRHFCIVTNRSDPEGGSGLDLIRWHRQKAGTIEHAHDVLMNELAGDALPSQKFGANAAWLRLNVILYNLLSAYKRVGLPEELHTARPKRLRLLLLNTVGKVVRHARETLLRCTKEIARALAGPPRTRFSLKRPDLAGV